MDPSGAPQPPQSAAYTAPGNATTTNPSEQRQQQSQKEVQSDETVARRVPETQSSGIQDAVPSSLGRGSITGGSESKGEAVEEKFGRTEEDVGRHRELEGEQMRAPGEGEVADVVERKPGASGEQVDLASDLDRKKEEQAAAREAIKEERRHGQLSEGGVTRGAVDTELDRTL